MKTKETKRAGVILQGLAEVEAMESQFAELRQRQWKKSEVEKLKQHYIDSPAYGVDALESLIEEIRVAEAEGRVVDDLAKTLANLDANPGGWIIPRTELRFMFDVGPWLMDNPPEASSFYEQKQDGYSIGWPAAKDVLTGVARSLADHGRVALEGPGVHSGLVYESVQRRHPWIARAFISVDVQQETPEDAQLVAAQEEWAVGWERFCFYIVERFRIIKADNPTARPEIIDPMILLGDLEFYPGFRWYGFQSRAEFLSKLSMFKGQVRESARRLVAPWKETRTRGWGLYQTQSRDAAVSAGRRVLGR